MLFYVLVVCALWCGVLIRYFLCVLPLCVGILCAIAWRPWPWTSGAFLCWLNVRLFVWWCVRVLWSIGIVRAVEVVGAYGIGVVGV